MTLSPYDKSEDDLNEALPEDNDTPFSPPRDVVDNGAVQGGDPGTTEELPEEELRRGSDDEEIDDDDEDAIDTYGDGEAEDENSSDEQLRQNQVTDSNLDSHELYDEGLSGAAEAEDPLSRNDRGPSAIV